MFAFPSVNLGECFNQHKNGNECRLVDKYENVKKLIEKEGLKWLGKTEDFRDSPRIRVGFGFQGKYDSHGYIWILTEMHWKIVEEESKLFLLDFFALMLIYLPNGVMNDEDSIEGIMKMIFTFVIEESIWLVYVINNECSGLENIRLTRKYHFTTIKSIIQAVFATNNPKLCFCFNFIKFFKKPDHILYSAWTPHSKSSPFSKTRIPPTSTNFSILLSEQRKKYCSLIFVKELFKV